MVMNDASEVLHGTRLVRKFFASDASSPFWECLNRIDSDFESRLKSMYDAWIDDLETNTYVACLSEHDEDNFPDGKLSMWRAYGRSGGVAFVLDPYFLAVETDRLETYAYPVIYCNDQQAEHLFRDLCQRVVMAEKQLRGMPVDDVQAWCLDALQTFGLTMKHPAFQEEREWRIVHRPRAYSSPYVKAKTVSISGTPQVIYELPINEAPRDDGTHISMDRLLSGIIIGPTSAPEVVAKALVAELSIVMDEETASSLVRFSNIPIRR